MVGLELGAAVAVTTDCGEPAVVLPSSSDVGEVWSFGCAVDDDVCGGARVSSGGRTGRLNRSRRRITPAKAMSESPEEDLPSSLRTDRR